MPLTPEQRTKRKRIMGRSMALGHCVCDPTKPCPCPLFRERDVCECAGERLPPASVSRRLTDHVRSAGCASKIGKADLHAVLDGLPAVEDARVLVGAAAGDDAGVLRLDGATDTVLTVDVFAPSVDDAYTFGRVAAANSASDIYAMGAAPQAALSIVGFPIHTLPADLMREMLRGGVDALAEAGVPVVGGHSINDEELKLGFAVLGTAPAGRFLTHEGARPGDALVLTKPVGGGVVLFGGQVNRADAAAIGAVTDAMTRMNRAAGEALFDHDAHAATDVTGFSLLGHLYEIVRKNGVEAALDFDAIPVFPGARALCRQDVLPGAVERNREAVPPGALALCGLADAQAAVLFSPETSGGLLVALPADRAGGYVAHLRDGGVADAAIIGEITGPAPGGRIRVATATAADWSPQALEPLAGSSAMQPETNEAEADAPCCCSGSPEPEPAAASSSCCAAPPTPPAEPDAGACCGGGEADAAEAEASTPVASAEGGFLPPLPAGESEAWRQYGAAVNAPGALGEKEKRLVGIALSALTKCAPCVKIQTRAAGEAGASADEIAEAAALGVSFGGAPVRMWYESLRRNGA